MELTHALLALPGAVMAYAYVGYPAALAAALAARGRLRGDRRPAAARVDDEGREWPTVAVVVVCYNEARAIRQTLERLLALDYPADRREILVVSDGSTDATNAIVGEYAGRGVRLVACPDRRGKSAAENAARHWVNAEIVVNVDATISVPSGSLKALVRAFDDPAVGVASGRDVSEGSLAADSNRAESGYVGYEMWVRSLETRLGSIVGASGCFYALRRSFYADWEAEDLSSRDFASVLVARRSGYRSVSVDDAVCVVPRAPALNAEFRRKTRTMAMGLLTLWYYREFMNPLRHGAFAFMLLSHKLCRWLASLFLPIALLALAAESLRSPWALAALIGLAAVTGFGTAAMAWPRGKRAPAPFALCGYVLAANVAGALAWKRALVGPLAPTWEPTRRDSEPGTPSAA